MKAADLSAGHAGRGLWAVGWRGLGARWRGFGQMLAAGADALRWGVRRGDDPRLGTSWADGCRRARWLSDRRRRGRGSNHRAPGRAPWTALRCSPPERRCFYRPPWAAWSRWPGSSRNVTTWCAIAADAVSERQRPCGIMRYEDNMGPQGLLASCPVRHLPRTPGPPRQRARRAVDRPPRGG